MTIPSDLKISKQPQTAPGLDLLLHPASRIDKFVVCSAECDRYSSITVRIIFGFETQPVDQVLAPQIHALTQAAMAGDTVNFERISHWEHTTTGRNTYLLINGDFALDSALIASVRVGTMIVHVTGGDKDRVEEIIDAAALTLRTEAR